MIKFNQQAPITILLFLISALVLIDLAQAQPQKILTRWEFNKEGDLEGWVANASVLKPEVSAGCLKAKSIGSDPIIVGPIFEIPASPYQYIEIKLKSDKSGAAEFFWTNTTQEPFGGFRPGKETPFQVTGNNQFHVYKIFPFWHAEGKIIHLRLDPPDEANFQIDYIRIMEKMPPISAGIKPATTWDFQKDAEGWQALNNISVDRVTKDIMKVRLNDIDGFLMGPPIEVNSDDLFFASVRMKVDKGEFAELGWLSDTKSGLQRHGFSIKPDNSFHTYNIDLSRHPGWEDRIIALTLKPSDIKGAKAEIEFIKVSDQPQGPPELKIIDCGLEDAINRAGQPAKLACQIQNIGGETAINLKATLKLTEELKLVEGEITQIIDRLEFNKKATFRWTIQAQKPLKSFIQVTIAVPKVSSQSIRVPVSITPKVSLPPTLVEGRPYVPEPKIAKTDYLVGVYYFPGWNTAGRWQPILGFPERKPVLGWYREGDPEVADWHIKWALEHGISFFAYDWYWCQGGRQLEHALHHGFLKSKYRKYFKFCLLWANHNPDNTSSEEDMLNVTRYWLDNYFHLPEYLKIEGKPVVIIFSPYRITKDMGVERTKLTFDKMRQMCQSEGLNGLYFIACAGPDKNTLMQLKEEGYDAVSGYNYPSAGMPAGAPRRFPYDAAVTGYRDIWYAIADQNLLPYIALTDPGWDSRPWHGDNALVRTGKTPDKFKKMLQYAKKFADDHPIAGNKIVLVEAWNEFGEGDFIEPHRQWGFQYLDAIREVFTSEPRAYHIDITPKDVGLGPYEVEPVKPQLTWEFDKGGQFEGWNGTMNVGNLEVKNGTLRGITTGNDPAFFGPPTEIDASKYKFVRIRMKLDKGTQGQLFWATSTSPTSEKNSCRFEVIPDNQFHEYLLDLSQVKTWRGEVTHLRLDPNSDANSLVEVDYIRVGE